MLSICMCVTEFDIVLGKCSLVNSSDVLRHNCDQVSQYGMRCLQYIPLARLYGGVLPPVLFNAFRFKLTTSWMDGGYTAFLF